jgi:hypothetical protein
METVTITLERYNRLVNDNQELERQVSLKDMELCEIKEALKGRLKIIFPRYEDTRPKYVLHDKPVTNEGVIYGENAE